MQDRLVISIADEKGMKQFSMRKRNTKFIFIGTVAVCLLFLISFLGMRFLMAQINDIAFQKKNSLMQYHSIYQKNTILKNIIKEKDSELSEVNSKIDKLEGIINIGENNKHSQFDKADLQNLTDEQRLLLLSLIPNGSPLKDFEVKTPTAQRLHPLKNKIGIEGGMDYITPKKTPVYATADGAVVLIQNNGKTGFGNLIKITHSFGFTSMYAHLDTISVKKGDFIQKGQLIGYSGNSGKSNGDRLYYEVSFLNTSLNPTYYADWNIDNFDAIFQEENSIDWHSLVWAIEDVTKLQTFKVTVLNDSKKVESL